MNRSILWRIQLGVLSNDRSTHGASIEDSVSRYEEILARYPFPSIDANEPPSSLNDAAPSPDLDPLTALLVEEEEKSTRRQEMDLKYRREKARKKRGLGAEGDSCSVAEDEQYDEAEVALQIIDKDLQRLPLPLDKDGHTPSDLLERETRQLVLRQALYVFQNEHPNIGYRQGMHEVASYILFVLEIDHGLSESIMQPTAMGAQLYSILEPVLVAIREAYDVPNSTNPKPLEAISYRVIELVHSYDSRLARFLVELPCPPQLYLTKWMRLLYAREVNDVIRAMDAWIQWQRDFGSLLQVLEAAAAARLLIHRHEILGVDKDALHFLMNVPVESDIGYFLHITSKVLQHDLNVDLPPVPVTIESVLPADLPIPTNRSSGLSGFPHLQSLRSTLEETTKSLGSTLEEKTKFFGLRLAQEWNHVAGPVVSEAVAAQEPSFSVDYRQPLTYDALATSTISQRQEQPGQLPRGFPEDARDSIRTIQAYLIDQQRSGVAVPQQVWLALSHLDFVAGGKK